MSNQELIDSLKVGDVVEIVAADWPKGTVLRGPVCAETTSWSTYFKVGHTYFDDLDSNDVVVFVERAPEPYYTNHRRGQPVAGDVARDEVADGVRTLLFVDNEVEQPKWVDQEGVERCYDGSSPRRLRLLVDGADGTVVSQ